MIKFTVPGDPVPYFRMTQGQVKLMKIPDRKTTAEGMKIKEKIRRYLSWKDFVAAHTLRLDFDRSPKKKVFMNVMIYFRSTKVQFADCENIRKGIQDAIFKQDKMVAGCVDFDYDAQNPRCEVVIINNQQGG